MNFVATHLGTHTQREGHPFLSRLLRALLPSANPDFDALYKLVRLWWVEIDDDGIPQREIGFGDGNEVLVAGPLEDNMGFWTDSAMIFLAGEHPSVDPDAFEAYWSRFVATWYGTRASGTSQGK